MLEEAGCIRSDDNTSNHVFKEMIEKSNIKKEVRLRGVLLISLAIYLFLYLSRALSLSEVCLRSTRALERI